MTDPDSQFWQEQLLATGASPSGEGTVSQELDDLLWALAEGRLESSDEQRLFDLVEKHALASRRLVEIQKAIESAQQIKYPDAAEAWARLTDANPVSNSEVRPLVDLVVRWIANGLEVLHSSGQEAFSPALARQGTTDRTSVANLFLTPLGTIRLTMDRPIGTQTEPDVTLTIEVVHRNATIRWEQTTIQLLGQEDQVMHSEPFQEQPTRIPNIRPGSYRVVLRSQGTEAILTVDISTS